MIPILEILTFVRVRSVPARSATSRSPDDPSARQELQGDEAARLRVSSLVDPPCRPGRVVQGFRNPRSSGCSGTRNELRR